ncbi:MAG: SDR family NAD(P)-dependent oxidoreductase [Pseudomonadota bacterium]
MSSKPVAVVTGAASGIGRDLALELDRRGYRLAICDLDEAGVAATGEALTDAFGSAVDVRSREAVEAFAGEVTEVLGAPDLVVHNAGVNLAVKVEDMALEDLDWVMQVNFWGMVYGCKAFLPSMLAAGGGMQVFISSVFGIVGVPTQSAYNASKFAIRGFAESLRQETEGRMNVLVVCPGGVRTNIVRNGRIHDWPTGKGRDPAAAFEKAARLSSQEAASRIAKAIEQRDTRLVLGSDARFLDAMQRLLPGSYETATRRLMGLLDRRS